MTELAADRASLAGNVAAYAEYYGIHFRTTVPADRLDDVLGRLRAAFSPEGVLAAWAIEDSLYAQTWSREDYDLFPDLRALRIPTLVIRGEKDFIPADVMHRIAAAIPGARFVEVAGTGHFSYLEQPDVVCSTIAEFLGSP
jgi:pimeloyl-ACP methyl ester carboxylesterase